MLKNFIIQVGRVSHELLLSGVLLGMYISKDYLLLSSTLQTIMLKATLVSLGFLHAHITNKIGFPAIDWSDADADKSDKIRAIVLYAMFIYAYAQGG